MTTDQMLNFEMPEVQVGEAVAWSPSGLTGDRDLEIAHVFGVSARNVNLITATKGVKRAVRHISDPKLKLNRDQREMGAWDFSDKSKEINQTLDDLKGEVSMLKRQMTAILAGKSREKGPKVDTNHGAPLTKYQNLRNKAKKMGIEVKGNPSSEWLKTQIANLEADASVS